MTESSHTKRNGIYIALALQRTWLILGGLVHQRLLRGLVYLVLDIRADGFERDRHLIDLAGEVAVGPGVVLGYRRALIDADVGPLIHGKDEAVGVVDSP